MIRKRKCWVEPLADLFHQGVPVLLSSATYSVKRIVPIEAGADFFFTGLGSLPRKLTRLKLLV